MTFQIGNNVGGYEIVGLLGVGGMGQVYKVRHLISDRLEAMKVVLPERQDDPHLKERFEREIKVHASLNHPNIAALHTALWMEGRLLMIMELVEGVSLAEKLRQGPLPIREGVEYIRQALGALGYAHAHGVVHRDVKPANILITPAGAVKLTDFGIARAVRDSAITQSGMAVGSLFYMSPEQIKGGPIDGRSDLYSVGVTLYETLTGRRPIHGESDYAIMRAHLEQPAVSPSDWIAGFPAPLSEIMLKSLAKDPAERFQTAEEFQAALESVGGADLISPGLTAATSALGTTSVDTAMLGRIEKCLAQALGPVARPLVARTARRVPAIPDLCRELAEQIPAEADRRAFLKCCETQTGEITTGRAPTATRIEPATKIATAMNRQWSPEVLEKARKELARHIGPLARILVERTARKAQTSAELVETLSQEIPNARDREAFAAMLRRDLS